MRHEPCYLTGIMQIQDDVKKMARHFGVDPALIQAIVVAEHNIVRAVQCTYPHITTRDEALDVTCRSAVHAMSDYVKAHAARDFLDLLGARWAPRGVANDPHDLNANWVPNVRRLWLPALPSRVDTGADIPGGGAV